MGSAVTASSFLAPLLLLLGIVGKGDLETKGDTVYSFIPPAAVGMEQRCADLVDGCVCSEPLNAGANLAAEPDRFWNPQDSVTKGCDSNPNDPEAVTMRDVDWATTASNPRANDASVPFQSGANPYVYRTKIGGIQFVYGNPVTDVDEETVCIRAYLRYSSDAGIPSGGFGGGQRLKNLQLSNIPPATQTHVDLQHVPDGTGDAYIQIADPRYSAPSAAYYTPTQFHQKCQADWCRIEACADQIGTHLYYRFRIFYLTTGETLNVNHDAGEGPSSTSWNLPHLQLFAEGACCAGHQFVSHVMQARVPVNQNFWIGEAVEIE
jgi:hypothetical protein